MLILTERPKTEKLAHCVKCRKTHKFYWGAFQWLCSCCHYPEEMPP